MGVSKPGGQYTILEFCVVGVDMMVEQELVDLAAYVHQPNMYYNLCVGLVEEGSWPTALVIRNVTSAGLKSDGAWLASVQLVSECCKLLLTKKAENWSLKKRNLLQLTLKNKR